MLTKYSGVFRMEEMQHNSPAAIDLQLNLGHIISIGDGIAL